MTKYRYYATSFPTKSDAIKAAKKAETQYPNTGWEIRQYRKNKFYVLFEGIPQINNDTEKAWL